MMWRATNCCLISWKRQSSPCKTPSPALNQSTWKRFLKVSFERPDLWHRAQMPISFLLRYPVSQFPHLPSHSQSEFLSALLLEPQRSGASACQKIHLTEWKDVTRSQSQIRQD